MERNKKYDVLLGQFLILEGKPKLYRIMAMRDIPSKGVQEGDFGGWVEGPDNLSQDDDCWIGDLAMVYGGAVVKGFAEVSGRAEICDKSTIQDHAIVSGNAVLKNVCLKGCARVSGNAEVKNCILTDFASVIQDARVSSSELNENAVINGHATIYDSHLYGQVEVNDYAELNNCMISGTCKVSHNAKVNASTLKGGVMVCGNASVTSSDLYGKIVVNGDAEINKCTDLWGDNIVIGHNAVLYSDNYIVLGPLAEEACIIFYISGREVLASVDDEVFSEPNELIVHLDDKTRIPTRYLRKLVRSTMNMMRP